MNKRVLFIFLLLTCISASVVLNSLAVHTAQAAVANCNKNVQLCNPLGDNNMNFDQLFNLAIDALMYVGAIAGVVLVIYAGFLFVTASGNPAKIETAKKTLMYTLIGIAILFGARIIVSIVTTTLDEIKNAAK